MSLCTDQIVLMLADPERVASVHWLTQDPNESALWERARRYAGNHALPEEIIRLEPDLVLGGRYNSPFTLEALRRSGIDVLIIEDAIDFEGVRRNIRLIASSLQEAARGESLVKAFDQALDRSRSALKDLKLSGLVYGSGGYSAGPPSLFDEVLTHLGIENIARGGVSGSWIRMGLEDLVRARPDIVFLGHYRPDSPSLAGALLAHSAIERSLDSGRRIPISTHLWNCGTPLIAEAAEKIVEELASAWRTNGG